MMKRMNPICKLLLTAVLLAASPAVRAQLYDDSRMMSFESSADLQGIKAFDSKVSLSPLHYKNGSKSLEWTFQPGGVLTIDKDL